MNKDKQIMDEFEIYESLIRKNANQKYIDCQMDRVIETIKKSQREEIVKKIEKIKEIKETKEDKEVHKILIKAGGEQVRGEIIGQRNGYNRALEEIINLITKEQ